MDCILSILYIVFIRYGRREYTITSLFQFFILYSEHPRWLFIIRAKRLSILYIVFRLRFQSLLSRRTRLLSILYIVFVQDTLNAIAEVLMYLTFNSLYCIPVVLSGPLALAFELFQFFILYSQKLRFKYDRFDIY